MVHFVVDAELAEALKAGPTGDLTFIVGARGQPLNKGSFGNSFDLACKAAGVKATAHGLRKARATSVAEAGASEAELDSMFGWRRGSHMSTVYTQDADRVLLAESGAQKLAQKSNVYSRTLLPGAGIKPKRSKVSKT
jgi:integrase